MRTCEFLGSCIIAFICTVGWYRILAYHLKVAHGAGNVAGPIKQDDITIGGEKQHATITSSLANRDDDEKSQIEDVQSDEVEVRLNTSFTTSAEHTDDNAISPKVPLLLESSSYWPRFTAAARKPFRSPCPGRKFSGPIVGSNPLRFFIYPLPPDLIHAADIKKLDKTTQMNRAFEPAVHKVMANHPARTLDPEEASFFLIPAHLSCVANVWLSQSGGGVCSPCNSLEKRIIDFMNSYGKYWSRNGGVDHIVSSYTCPRPYDKLPYHKLWPRGEPLRCAPIELCLRTKSRESVDEFRAIKVPYHVPDSEYADLSKVATKNISVYFAGSYLAILGNKRQPIVDALPKIPRGVSFVFDRKAFNQWPTEAQNQVLAEMSRNYTRAEFIAVPQGDTTVESRRTYQAIANGCVPIVLSGKFGPNLPEALDWSEFSVSFDLDVLFEKPGKSGLSRQEFERNHAQQVQDRIEQFIKGMSSVTIDQMKYLREGLVKNRDLLRYGDDGKGGLGTSILKALERRREAFKL